MIATDKLLEEFPPVSTAQWEAAIAADLKGASYEEKLIWHAPEGLTVRPYYRAEDLAGLDWADTAPGLFPFVRGARAQAGWRIREQIASTDAAEANRAALSAVAAGAEEIAFGAVSIASASELALLLVNLDEIPVHFACADEKTVRLLLEFLHRSRRIATISAGFNPLENLDFAAEILGAAPPNFVPFTIDASHTAPADANPMAQAGWALAAGVDFLGATVERGIDADRAASGLEFGFDLGANYFFEIARLRAFRMLWARVLESFGGARMSAQARIAARTAFPETAAADAHWNILRATTETMSAILGGADSICVTPFTHADEAENEAARRLARNTQLLLKKEAFLDCVADPGGGSYYLETLTGSIAARSWEVMQAIEAGGGCRMAQKTRMVRQQQEGAR